VEGFGVRMSTAHSRLDKRVGAKVGGGGEKRGRAWPLRHQRRRRVRRSAALRLLHPLQYASRSFVVVGRKEKRRGGGHNTHTSRRPQLLRWGEQKPPALGARRGRRHSQIAGVGP
jgi:hypothetical protein